MKLSRNGLNQITQREGVILHAYQDTVGVWTIGTGHTSAAGAPVVTPGLVITKAQNDEILRRDLAPIEKQVNDAVKVPISQNQYDAIVSIIFNVGPKFLNSTSMRKLNQKDYAGAADAIMLWNKPSEIIGRRATEKKQFQTPDTTPVQRNAQAGAITTATAVAAGSAILVSKWIALGLAVAGVTWLLVHFYNKGKEIQHAQLAQSPVAKT